MKKILLIVTIITSFLSSILAFADENSFYLKAEIGADRIKDIKIYDKKLKNNKAVFFGGGVGYYILDNVRTDLTLDYYANQRLKHSSSPGATNLKIEPKITNLMVSGYVDIMDISICTVFIGAGVGISQLKNSATIESVNANNNNTSKIVAGSKKKNSLAYQLLVGASVKIAPRVRIDASYSWKDLGATKEIANLIKSLKYKGHHITIGLRVDI
jgi:opacity protein-like surface antigen